MALGRKSYRQYGEWGIDWMGNLWRNREFCWHMGTLVCVGGVLSFIGFGIQPAAGRLVLLLLLVALGFSWWFSARRYQQLAELSERINRIASGDYSIPLGQCAEGELSILASELHKLTAALMHQTDALQKDKTFLSHSLADISHQLKAPLTSMSMLVELLEAPNLPEEKRAEFLDGLRQSIDRTRWLILSLLKLSKLDAGAVVFRLEPVDLAQAVKQALAPLHIPMELKAQSLVLDLEQDLTVLGDEQWLSEAIGNLIKNSVEHTPIGGEIIVHCRKNALYTELQVLDNGPGITPEDLPHLFERFYRGKGASADSVGIGLALTKSILQKQSGVLTAGNRTQGGACFTIKLYGDVVV